MPQVPYKAPEINGIDSGETVFKHIPVSGSWTVLYFYPKVMTSGCTVQAQDFQNKLQAFEKQGGIVIGVSKDSFVSHGKFEKKEGLKFLLLSDERGDLCERFGVWMEKSMYGRKFMGIERSTFIINSRGEVVKEWRKVKVAGHVDEVLASLSALSH